MQSSGRFAFMDLRVVSFRPIAAMLAFGISVTGGVLAARLRWPAPMGLALVCHLGAFSALVWAAVAEGLRRFRPSVGSGTVLTEAAGGLDRVALGGGVLAVVILVFEVAVVGLLRTGLADPRGQSFQTSAGGLADLAMLVPAVCLNASARRAAVPLFWLLVAGVVWTAMMIPTPSGPIAGSTAWLPMPWTLWLFIGLSLVLTGFVIAQEAIHRHRRRRAWPDRLEWFVESPDPWPGFRPSAAAVAIGLLPLGAYHAGFFVCVPFAVMSGAASLWLAHRLWNANFADVGMALVTLAVVGLVVACVPDSVGGVELATRMPLLLGAALLGLSVMVFIWHWLPNVWDQQLDQDRPWTTTGRMIPVARRFGLIVGAFAVLVSMQLAVWPRLSSTRDDTLPRWALGLLANALVVTSLVLATRLSQRRGVAYLALLSLVVAGGFVGIRMSDNILKHWVMSYWPIALASGAPVCLGLSRLARRGRWQPFVSPLQIGAVLTLPALAVFGVIFTTLHPVAILLGKIIRYDVEVLQIGTFAILAASYGLYAFGSGGRTWKVAAGVCLLLSLASFGRTVLVR